MQGAATGRFVLGDETGRAGRRIPGGSEAIVNNCVSEIVDAVGFD